MQGWEHGALKIENFTQCWNINTHDIFSICGPESLLYVFFTIKIWGIHSRDFVVMGAVMGV